MAPSAIDLSCANCGPEISSDAFKASNKSVNLPPLTASNSFVLDRHVSRPMAGSNEANNMLLIDGGMGHQLKAMGVKIEGKVGSLARFLGVASANVDDPQLVTDAHLAYIDAGATVITTNSYSVTPNVLALMEPAMSPKAHSTALAPSASFDGKASFSEKSETDVLLERLLVAACNTATAARDARPNSEVQIAGCLPPLAESYRYDLVADYEDNLRNYRTICSVIAPRCDILLCETMSTIEEAVAAATAAAEHDKPIWVAFTLDECEPTLRNGEAIVDAVAALAHLPVAAMLFNCTSPESISAAMPLLRDAPGRPPLIGGYANGFLTTKEGSGEYRDLSEAEYYEFVSQWMDSGALCAGGCCGIFPRHIDHMHKRFTGQEIVERSPSSAVPMTIGGVDGHEGCSHHHHTSAPPHENGYAYPVVQDL